MSWLSYLLWDFCGILAPMVFLDDADTYPVVDQERVPAEECGILGAAQQAPRELRIEHSTIQLEHPGHVEHEAVCGGQ